MGTSVLRDFSPQRTITVLKAVRQQHVRRAGEPGAPHDDLLGKVRRVLLDCEDLGRLIAAAHAFTTAELHATLHLLAIEEHKSIRIRILAVLRERRRRDLIRLAWRLIVERYSNLELETAFRELSGSFGIRDVCGDNAYQEARLATWLRSEKLSSAMAADFDALEASDLDAWLQAVSVSPAGALARAVWIEALTCGSATVMRRMRAELLVSRAGRFPTSVQHDFGVRYLTLLGSRSQWADVVLAWIRRQCGVPAIGDAQTPFWRRVAEPVRDEFRRWVQERTLFEFFSASGDTLGRFQYWRRFSSLWKDVHAALDNRVMLMDFGSFGVVEFAEHGNAAYVYEARHFRAMASGDARYISDFKDKTRVYERILHFDGWQYRTDAVMVPLLKAGRASA